MTPMRDRLTYNNDDTGNMSPLASSSYSPPFYLHTSGIDYSSDPHRHSEDKIQEEEDKRQRVRRIK